MLTGHIGGAYVAGVQEGGIGVTVKRFVANDSETDRMSVNVLVSPRALRELYLAPFEHIVKTAAPYGILAAYNGVNGPTMTEQTCCRTACCAASGVSTASSSPTGPRPGTPSGRHSAAWTSTRSTVPHSRASSRRDRSCC
ncbi:hypothetical protein ACU635_33520 [[Actinomadura] parvosata]|uniref:hypothetical protein n=1 Tax=[Actinomadura] parvosata TaxID=1955412 RepID=UPI00406C0063